jgi:hypothetical protein
MPQHVAMDEKHIKILKEKAYVATTVANGCLMGAEVSIEANASSLTQAYAVFSTESKNIDSSYVPTSANVDGWEATSAALRSLFSGIVLIHCFLHGFIKIRDRCRKSAMFSLICGKVWYVYKAKTKKAFSQRLRRFKAWSLKNVKMPGTLSKIESLCDKSKLYQVAYDYPEGYRTSSICDRSMKWMKKSIFIRQNFHGTLSSANASMRSWALLRNYYPYCLKKLNDKNAYMSPATELNGFCYADNWLQNLMVSSSMNGYRQ